MALLDGLKSTGRTGVFYKEHETRKHGVKKDRLFVLRFTVRGKAYVEAYGWASEGKTELSAEQKIMEFKANGKRPDCTGPFCLADERAVAKKIAQDRQLEAERQQPFAKLAEAYLGGLNVRPKTKRAYVDGLALAADYKPAKGLQTIGETLITDIPKRHLAQLIESIAKRSPSTAVSVRSALSAFYTWLAEPSREYVEVNFIPSIPKPKANTPRERTLVDAEIVKLWSGLEENDVTLTRLLRFLFLTGVRLSEALNLDRREIDGQWWTIPGARTKSKRPHRVFLTKSALALLADQVEPFANPATGKAYSESSLLHFIRRQNSFGLDRFSPHDARRTVASGLALLGFHSDSTAAILSHRIGGVTELHYLRHNQDREKKRASLAWERHVIRITTGADSKVVNLQAWK